MPLEYFATALRWLARRPESAGWVAVLGQSRGAELALLLGATFAEVRAVVELAPSNVVWGSLGPGSGEDVPAWTFDGRPIPWMTTSNEAAWAEAATSIPYVGTPAFLGELDNVEAVEAAAIPIERSRCPILMVSGEDDAMWPSTAMAERVVERARALGSGPAPVHLRFSRRGTPLHPATWAPEPRGVATPGRQRARRIRWYRTRQRGSASCIVETDHRVPSRRWG